MKHLLAYGFLLLSLPQLAAADGDHGPRPDGHAPIGVMADHMHQAGEWMLAYRFMRMEMAGNRDGEDDLSPQDVINRGYMSAPLKMTTDMHMLGAMLAPSDAITWTAMLPYLDKSMRRHSAMGTTATSESEGVGDLKLSALIRWFDRDNHYAHFMLGISAPTGSIDEKTVMQTPMGARRTRMPYGMQLGSGTWDLRAGLTYTAKQPHWSWGGQASWVTRLEDENDNGYALGDEMQLTGWLARRLSESFSASLRIAGKSWDDIDGRDPALNPNMNPGADPDLRGGKRIDAGLGVNWISASGHRLAVEWLEPVYQDLDGPQLKRDGALVVGWQKAY